MEFVALLEGALILKSADTFEFYLCEFDDDESRLPVAKLVVPDNIPSPSKFIPFYFDDADDKILVAVSNDQVGNLYDYTIPE